MAGEEKRKGDKLRVLKRELLEILAGWAGTGHF